VLEGDAPSGVADGAEEGYQEREYRGMVWAKEAEAVQALRDPHRGTTFDTSKYIFEISHLQCDKNQKLYFNFITL
jgi:hypothetical protein